MEHKGYLLNILFIQSLPLSQLIQLAHIQNNPDFFNTLRNLCMHAIYHAIYQPLPKLLPNNKR